MSDEKNQRLLVIDDNRAIHEDFRKIFSASGSNAFLEADEAALFGEQIDRSSRGRFEIDSAFQGQEGLALVEKAIAEGRPYVLAFVDIRMPPGWDGIETIARIWKVCPDLQVVICTAYSDYSWEEMNAKLGESDQLVILKKPFDTIEVLQLANALAEKWRLALAGRDQLRNIEETVTRRTEALRESEEQFRSMFELASIGMAQADPHTGQWLRVNEKMAAITGYTVEELLNKRVSELTHPEDRDKDWELFQKVVRRETTDYRIEKRYLRKDGTVAWVSVNMTVIRDVGGEPIRTMATIEDITERKEAEVRLKEQTAHARLEAEVTLAITKAQSKQEMLQECAQAIVRHADAAFARIWTHNPAEQMLELEASAGLYTHTNGPHGRVPVGKFKIGLIAQERKSHCTNSVVGDSRVSDQEWAKREGMVAFAGYPLVVGDELIGVLAMFTRQPLSEATLRTLESVSLTLAIGIERKQVEKKLRLQTSALEAAASGILITDRNGYILWVNPAFTTLTGYGIKEVVGKTPAILKSGKHDSQFYDRMWKTILGGDVWRHEVINRRKNGSLYHEEMTITPVLDQNGEILNFIAIKQDISRRKRNEEELRSREESFRALADNGPDAVCRINQDFRFVYGNRMLEQQLGMPSAEFLGKTGAELGLPPHVLWDEAIRDVFRTGEAKCFEFEFQRPDGVRHFEARLVPERSATGKVDFVLAMSRDITERKATEKERQLMDVQLRQAQKLEAIGQLAAGIAHEINTPTQYVGDNTRFFKDSFASMVPVLKSHQELLQAARSNTLTPDLLARAEQILAAGDLDYLFDQVPAAIGETLEGVERVTKIVRAMKEFSHPGGKEKSAADLNKAIESTVTVARNEWKYVADVKLDLDPALPPVPCFLGEFNQCILNLIVNASHAIADVLKEHPGTKGNITVQTRQDGDHVEVRVGDTGTGIPESARPKIFEPFFTTKEVGKGTGQGLSIVYGSIVKKHGGTVNFETEMGKGTTFILRLPITPVSNGESKKIEKPMSREFNTEMTPREPALRSL